MTFELLIEEIRLLPVADRKRLISVIVDTLTLSDEPLIKQRSILEFEGIGAEMWHGLDAQDYVNRLRDEWDETL